LRISPEKEPNEETVMDVSDDNFFSMETTQLQGVEGDVNPNTSLALEHLHKTPLKKHHTRKTTLTTVKKDAYTS